MPEIVVTKRDGSIYRAQISDEDADLAQVSWCMGGGKGKTGKYLTRKVDGRTVYLHRVVAHRCALIEAVIAGGRAGEWLESIDHVNGDRLDNRRSNLRLADRKTQSTNSNDPLAKNNSSGHRGVYRVKASGRWVAQIQINGRQTYLGSFPSIDDAVAARKSAEQGSSHVQGTARAT